MPVPILVGIVLRAAGVAAMRAIGGALAKGAVRRALQRKFRRAAREAQRRLDARDAARRRDCPRCKELQNKCDLLRGGNPLGSGPYRGGNYNGTRGSPGMESHHVPAQGSYPATNRLSAGRMPAIQMDAADHAQTASYGSSTTATQYRAAQRRMIRSGNITGAFLMDVADIKAKFGDKYDEALAEAMAYLACLKKEGKVR